MHDELERREKGDRLEAAQALYVGASEDAVRRFTQHQQAYDQFQTGNNDGWSTPDFTRKHHRAVKTIQLQFVDGGQCCATQELDTFMQWFHVNDCNLEIVRGGDWCRPVIIESARARIAIAQKLKEGKLQDLGKMISEHQKNFPSRRLLQTNTMGERPIGPRLVIATHEPLWRKS